MRTFKNASIKEYLNEISKHPLLTPDEEIELSRIIHEAAALEEPYTPEQRRLRKRAERAKARMVNGNLRLVVTIAKRFAQFHLSTLDIMDLIQEGTVGLIRATELFDGARGYKFSTYAYWWIRQSINRGIAYTDTAIRLPAHISQVQVRLPKFYNRYVQKLGRPPSYEELAKDLNCTVDTIQLLHTRPHQTLSLDAPVTESTQLWESIEDPSQDQEMRDLALEIDLQSDAFYQVLKHLDSITQEIILGYFGLLGHQQESQAQLAKRFNLSRTATQKRITKGLHELRSRLLMHKGFERFANGPSTLPSIPTPQSAQSLVA